MDDQDHNSKVAKRTRDAGGSLSPEEIDARREAGLKKLLAMPPQPQQPLKKAKQAKKRKPTA
jgi:uncharacterized protein with WD repeat